MLQKKYFMVFERYIPELKKYDGISFLHQPMTSGQPLKIVQRHMAHPVGLIATAIYLATRRACLEAREAGFLVILITQDCIFEIGCLIR